MEKAKRIMALIGVIIIIGMYLTTFVMAIIVKSLPFKMFVGCFVVTILVPVILYIMMWIYGVFYKKDRNKEIEELAQKIEEKQKIAEIAKMDLKQEKGSEDRDEEQ